MLNESTDPRQIVKRKLLNVVVASPVHIVGLILVSTLFIHLLGMVERHYLISTAVDDIHGTIYILDAIDIWELVKWQSPPQVKHHAQGRHQPTIDYHASDRILLSDVASRS